MQLSAQLIHYHVLVCIIIYYKPKGNIIPLLSPLCVSQFQLGTSLRATPGDWLKNIARGSGFDFWKLPGGQKFNKGGDFVEIQSEIFCLCIGFISDKYKNC